MKKYLFIAIVVSLFSCKEDDKPENGNEVVDPPAGIAAPANLNVNIIAQYPHDTSAYTQGLEFYKGKLYEGTGDYETSSLRITDFKTGKVEKKYMMGSAKIFGEGITIFKDKIYQLTWENHLVNVYNVNDITKPIKTFTWPNEGWGITHNDSLLIVSDGTANIYFVNPDDFRVMSTVGVVDNLGSVDSINELEYINGFIYANIYQYDYIVKIDPISGHVVGRINLPGLKDQYFKDQYIPNRTDVLNGIAYDSATKKLYITGKRWPKLFEISLN